MYERCEGAAAEIMFLCGFSSPKHVFQTLKNCNSFSSSPYLFVHISPLSTSLPHSLWVQSRTILSTHKIRLLIFASWHLRGVAFQEGDLWETLSPT